MAEALVYTFALPVYPERVYRAWLDGGEMRRITGQPAQIDARPGGAFALLDGRVTGVYETLTPYDLIRMTWQMAAPGAPAGKAELVIEPTCTGSEVTLTQRGIPAGQTPNVLDWWEHNLSRPLKRYFDALVGESMADLGDG